MLKKTFMIFLVVGMMSSCTYVRNFFNDDASFEESSNIPRKGLRAEFLFNGNSNDSGPKGIDGITLGASLTKDRFGMENAAYQFNGTDNEVAFENTSALNVSEDGFTVSVWIKAGMNQLSKDQHYMIMGNLHKSKTGWGIQGCLDHHDLKLLIANGKGFPSAVFDGKKLLDDRWHHFVGTFDGSTIRTYLDGELQAKKRDIGIPLTNDKKFAIGRFPHENKRFFNGILDDIRIYDLALGRDEIKSLYAENNWKRFKASQ